MYTYYIQNQGSFKIFIRIRNFRGPPPWIRIYMRLYNQLLFYGFVSCYTLGFLTKNMQLFLFVFLVLFPVVDDSRPVLMSMCFSAFYCLFFSSMEFNWSFAQTGEEQARQKQRCAICEQLSWFSVELINWEMLYLN